MANAMLLAMELTIDKFGRVVLPKKLREHLGVGPASKSKSRRHPKASSSSPFAAPQIS
jgi:bifunctional DNA-binding transcriptional regulator/antitoxin component of YhaV-PrlF toxin-antitoxin module